MLLPIKFEHILILLTDLWKHPRLNYEQICAAPKCQWFLIYFTGTTIGVPLSLTRNTTNFAGLVWLAFFPTT